MVNKAVQAALRRLWTDSVTIYHREKVTDDDTKITGFQETPLLEDQPCKLSFETLNSTDGEPVAAVSQVIKLFLSPDITVPAGCKVVVTRPNDTERVLTYASSGEPGVFHNHQEIILIPFEGWA